MKAIKGMNLIEIMVSVAIVAVIATIGVPAYTSNIDKTTVANGIRILETYKDRGQQYFLKHGTWPSSEDPISGSTTIEKSVEKVLGFTSDTSESGFYQVIVAFKSTSVPVEEAGTVDRTGQGARVIYEGKVNNGVIEWKCKNDPEYVTPPRLLPTNCAS